MLAFIHDFKLFSSIKASQSCLKLSIWVLVVGAEAVEVILLTGGETVNDYSTDSAAIGFQLCVQVKKTLIILLQKAVLNKFSQNDSWEVDIDGSVTLIESGTGKSFDTLSHHKTMAGLIFGTRGFMYNQRLKGSKISHIVRKADHIKGASD